MSTQVPKMQLTERSYTLSSHLFRRMAVGFCPETYVAKDWMEIIFQSGFASTPDVLPHISLHACGTDRAVSAPLGGVIAFEAGTRNDKSLWPVEFAFAKQVGQQGCAGTVLLLRAVIASCRQSFC